MTRICLLPRAVSGRGPSIFIFIATCSIGRLASCNWSGARGLGVGDPLELHISH